MRIPFLPQVDLRRVEDVILDATINGLRTATPTITKRTPQSAGSPSPSFSCAPNDNSGPCERPAAEESGQTLAIILGVIIPLSAAVLVLIYLHRRHMKNQALEDINDPHKSLDFGLDGMTPGIPRNKRLPEMTITDASGHLQPSTRKLQGLSMDVSMRSPYLLPAALNDSRESFHSMARSQTDEHDPYRPVTMLRSDNDSIRSARRNEHESIRSARRNIEKGSVYSNTTDLASTVEKAGLIANARPMSQSHPSPHPASSTSPHESLSSSDDVPLPPHPAEKKPFPSRKASLGGFEKPLPMPNGSDMEAFPPLQMPEPVAQTPPPRTSSAAPFPPRKQSSHVNVQPSFDFEVSSYDDPGPPPPVPISKDDDLANDDDPTADYTRRFSIEEPAVLAAYDEYSSSGLYAPQPMAGQRLSMMGLRPLPPDLPDDNPEQRANRIRSFYKEYFDDSKPTPARGHYGDQPMPALPFAQSMGRRAMTPPPRGPPRGSAGSAMGNAHGRKYSTQSMGRPGLRGRPGGAPRPKLPPPMPLHSLPTPHLLKGDIEVFNPLDFAPPSSFRQLQNGSRPDSPLGTERAYSPAVRAFTPLASSFDNLSVMPSPHELRKSSTFTALDFAPPSRIRDPNLLSANSDAGSIRSNRSGISAVQTDAIRAGAYRVSRIPKEMVTTREDLNAQLRPKMDMISRA